MFRGPVPEPTHPYQRRKDPTLSDAFAKDAEQEDFLEGLNRTLAPRAEAGYRDLPEQYPTLHVIGAPRSGTTLLYQLVAGELRLGYVNNLIAAFWLAPCDGIRLARALGLHELSGSSFDSSFGRTSGVLEPHEFGYFWNHHLRYPDLAEQPPGHEQTIDWAQLRRVLINMADAYERPMAFKPMLLTWHLPAIARQMPASRFVWIRRRPRDTALSLLKMRHSLRGSYDAWASLRPREAPADEPPWRQVAAQVVLIEREIERAAAAIGADRVLQVSYEQLCADPGAAIADVADLLAAAGHRPERSGSALAPFEPGRNAALEAEFGERVDEALAHYAEAFAAVEQPAVTGPGAGGR